MGQRHARHRPQTVPVRLTLWGGGGGDRQAVAPQGPLVGRRQEQRPRACSSQDKQSRARQLLLVGRYGSKTV